MYFSIIGTVMYFYATSPLIFTITNAVGPDTISTYQMNKVELRKV